MPNYYAHYHFGQEVLAALPALLRELLRREESAFEAGLYGPDPLFFSRPSPSANPRRIAMDMHAHSALEPSRRLLEAVRADAPFARGYAAGFLCHLALDSRCHTYIAARQDRPGLSHAGMEAELDRALMLREGIDPLRQTPLGRPALPGGLLKTAAGLYDITPGQFAAGFRMFYRLCRMQTRLGGTRVSRTADWVGRRWPRLSVVQGAVLSPAPDPLYDRTTRDLLALLDGEVRPTAQAVSRFFAAAVQGGELDAWFDRPFSGEVLPRPQAAAR